MKAGCVVMEEENPLGLLCSHLLFLYSLTDRARLSETKKMNKA